MSMITELIERLRAQKHNLYMKTSDGKPTYPLKLMLQAADTIEELSAKLQAANMERSSKYYNGGWIPVSERLPEQNVEVLVSTEWGSITIAERYSENDYFINEGATNADEDDIIAWMPLPKPYKESEDKE